MSNVKNHKESENILFTIGLRFEKYLVRFFNYSLLLNKLVRKGGMTKNQVLGY